MRNFIRLEHRAMGGPLLDKMHPECLNFVSIIRKCKLKISAIVTENIVGEEKKDAFSLSSTRRKSEIPNEFLTNEPRALANQTAISGNALRTKLRESL